MQFCWSIVWTTYDWTKPVCYEVFKAGALHDGSFSGLLDGRVAGGGSAAACSIATYVTNQVGSIA